MKQKGIKKDQERADSKRGQVGLGDRSERIRTYNFPQGRVSDHRINLTLYKIEEVVKNGQLDEFVEALIADDELKNFRRYRICKDFTKSENRAYDNTRAADNIPFNI